MASGDKEMMSHAKEIASEADAMASRGKETAYVDDAMTVLDKEIAFDDESMAFRSQIIIVKCYDCVSVVKNFASSRLREQNILCLLWLKKVVSSRLGVQIITFTLTSLSFL